MCGRIALNVNSVTVRDRVGTRRQAWVHQERFRPSTNVAPTRHHPVLLARQQLALTPYAAAADAPESRRYEDEPNRVIGSNGAPTGTEASSDMCPPPLLSEAEAENYFLHSMKWGLVTDSSIRRGGPQPINARDDSVLDGKPMFAPLRNQFRCVVVAQGFFEWVREGKKATPYYVHRTDGQLLYMAGLFTVAGATGTDTDPVVSCAIITTENTPRLAFMHDRMPALLDGAGVRAWLDISHPWSPALAALLCPRDEGLSFFAVDPRVGKAGVEDARFQVPYKKPDLAESSPMLAMWARKTKETLPPVDVAVEKRRDRPESGNDPDASATPKRRRVLDQLGEGSSQDEVDEIVIQVEYE
ncbi:hypothetical protein BC828DRAFT_379838 [Blastocladiella britannica]|nr:hypothetical protein BC828DRAFT_379838 [Blastocladiella britannica]